MNSAINDLTKKNCCFLFRMIIPAFPEVNIYTKASGGITALGPTMVATAVNKLPGWQAEIIDENNYRGPRDKQGLPDHAVLQRENPATVVGFYCGLSSTIERVWQLAEFYQQEKIVTIAGSWHAHYKPEETLNHNINVIVHGDGELVIGPVLDALQGNGELRDISGISFKTERDFRIASLEEDKIEILNLNNLPYPDFGLLRFAKIKWYPISRIRGCRMGCEFCSVKGKPRWADAKHFFNTIKWLKETRGARHFFIVDDRLEEDLEGTIEFFRMISEKYGNYLKFTVQIRLEAAENTELLEVMKKAGVRIICVGYESPIDKDLKTMRKGYSSARMLEYTKIWRKYFWVHGMFIAGYPRKQGQDLISADEIVKYFRKFIRESSLDTVQVMLPGPIVGTALRKRLETEGRIFPLEIVPWSRNDGINVCFEPSNMSIKEFQEIPFRIMSRFYDPLSFFRIPLRAVVFPIDYFIRGWKNWRLGWSRDLIKYGGSRLIKKLWKRHRDSGFVERLEEFQRNQKLH